MPGGDRSLELLQYSWPTITKIGYSGLVACYSQRSDHARKLPAEPRSSALGGAPLFLLDRARHGGKDVISIRTDQPDGTHNEYKDDGKHHGILRDVLALLLDP